MENQSSGAVKKYSPLNITAALLISTLLYLGFVNAATLPYLYQAFPGYSATTYKLFTTIPSLMMIICSLISGKLIQYFPIKKIVVASCTIIAITGFGSYFAGNLIFMLTLRVIFGLGFGIAFPLANAIIQQLFEGEQKAKLLGYRAAFGAIFGAVVSLLGGALTTSGWRNAFFGYLLAVPVAIFVAVFCPSNEPVKKPKGDLATNKEKKYTTRTFLVLLFAVIFNLSMMSFGVELPLVITGEKIGNANTISVITSINTFVAFAAGLVFGRAQKKAKRWMAILSAGPVCLALIIGIMAHSAAIFYIVGIVYGFGFGFYNPTFNLLIASTAAKPRYGSNAIAIYTSCVGFGQFISPYAIAAIKSLFGMQSIPRAEWKIASALLVIIIALACVYIVATSKEKKPVETAT